MPRRRRPPARVRRAVPRLRGRRRRGQVHPGAPAARVARAARAHGRRDPPAGRHAARAARCATWSCTATTSRRGPRRCCSPPTRPTTSTSSSARRSERGERRHHRPLHRLLGGLPGRRARPRAPTRSTTCRCGRVGGLLPDLTVVLDVTPRGRARRVAATCTTGSSPRPTPSTARSAGTSSTWPHATPSATSSLRPTAAVERLHAAVLERRRPALLAGSGRERLGRRRSARSAPSRRCSAR